MITVVEADRLLSGNLTVLPAETAPLAQAGGRVLRQEVRADRDQPPYDRVTMDGIAVASAAAAGGVRKFAIQGEQPAGSPPLSLTGPEMCVEVMTGAVLPAGCDCVIRIEDVDRHNGAALLRDGVTPAPWQYVHRRGSDCPAGTVILSSGQRLNAPRIGIAASMGYSELEVGRVPRVAVVATGDELVDVAEAPAPHQVRRSNTYAIGCALGRVAGAEVRQFHLRDEQAQLVNALGEILEAWDVLVLSGGVSMGRFDYVPETMRRLGVREVFHRVAQRPGKPLWFGITGEGKPVFGLPGNPVSALVCFHRYALPYIDWMQGGAPEDAPSVRLAAPVTFKPPLTYFLPVRLDRESRADLDGASASRTPHSAPAVWAYPCPTNTSGDFSALAATDGFVELDLEESVFPAGLTAPLHVWR